VGLNLTFRIGRGFPGTSLLKNKGILGGGPGFKGAFKEGRLERGALEDLFQNQQIDQITKGSVLFATYLHW